MCTVASAQSSIRPETWATPVKAGGLKNFYRLDEKVYRSSQPDRKEFKALRELGIKNILNLRDHHADDSKARGLKLRLFRVEMDAGDIKASDIIAALWIIRQSDGPILIHCWHGSDRTGAVSAMYRIIFQGWSKEDAIDELVHGGYGYHSIYGNIPRFIREASIEEIRKKVFAP